jgi:membrane protein
MHPAMHPAMHLAMRLAKADALRDYVRRVWIQSAEDNVFFLAGGLAFNILLALVPFALLLVSGLAFFLGRRQEDAVSTITGLLDSLLPRDSPSAADLLRAIVNEVLRTRGTVGVWSAVTFAWFSTRLFGSLRSVLAHIFDGTDRSIMAGKLFDFGATIVATLVVAVYAVFTAYLDLATTRGIALLVNLGLREDAMGHFAYYVGRATAVGVIIALFYALYRGLPRHRPSTRTALVAATVAAVLFELARSVFAVIIKQANPSSLYTGSIAAVVAVVFWVYYAALLFLIGGEVAQAYDLRRSELRALADQPAAPVNAAAADVSTAATATSS